MTKRLAAIIALCAVAGLGGCFESDMPPPGSYSEVVVVTEDGRDGYIAGDVERQLTRTLNYYVDADQQFRVRHIRASEFPTAPLDKNVVVCGVADMTTVVGQQVETLLGEDAVARAAQLKANLFAKENYPGPGQFTLVITAGSETDLRSVLDERGEELPDIIERSCRKRLRAYLLKDKRTKLSRRLYQTYGFHIEVPVFYRLLAENVDPAGIEILRDGPVRLLGIFWLDWETQPTLKNAKELFDVRRDYVWERYDGDQMDSTRTTFSVTKLGENVAIKMEGYWSNSRSVAGGYYETYYIFRENDRLLWAVDVLVFAPGLPKHSLFRELNAVAETFRFDK